jgi:hypothetical protein
METRRGARSTGVQEYRSSGVQEFRSTGVQEFRSSGVQEFRSSGVQEFRSRQENPECEEEHVIGKKTRLGNTIQGPSGEDKPPPGKG